MSRSTPRGPGSAAELSPGFSVWGGWLLYVAFVIYGSLVPLDYRPMPWAAAWQAFGQIALLDVGAAGRADWVANGVLYLPVGFLTASALAGRGAGGRMAGALGALGFVAVLALGVEFAQVFFPPRTVSLNDLFAEFVGGALGAGLAVAAAERVRHLLAAWVGGVERFAPWLLSLYALGYCAFSFFPFDFLLSAGELAEKLASDRWGWLWAGSGGRGGSAAGVAKLMAEALAAAPLGWLLASRGWGPGRAAAGGAALGVVIEVGQFFVVSGVAQGFSVLTRGVGVALGALAWGRRGRLDPLVAAGALRRWGLPLAALYGLVLVAVTGWFELPWRDGAEAALALQEVRFLPFYYHYYTTEQAALLSLVSVCLMYAPVGVLAWAFFLGRGMAGVLAALLAGAVEASKLFLLGQHPDPTNLLVAGGAAWLACRLARGAEGLARKAGGSVSGLPPPAGGDVAPPPLAAPGGGGARGAGDDAPCPSATPGRGPGGAGQGAGAARVWPGPVGLAGLAAAAGGVVWGVATFPVYPVLLGLALGGYGVVLWWRPQAMWVVVPAALALLDLAPWSGLHVFDEFDLLLLLSVAVGYARWPPARARERDGAWGLAVGLVVLVYGLATLRGVLPWPGLEANAFSHYYSPLNAVRIAKGAVWALLLAGLARRCGRGGVDVPRHFATGMVLGLAGTVAVVIWERWAFPGVFNFSDVYRVTGPFSQMHVGGADLECYLTAAAPFLVWKLLTPRSGLERGLGVLLLAASAYGVMVTFSRAGFVAFGVAVVVSAGLGLLAGGRPWRRGLAVAAMLALIGVVAMPVFQGGFTQERLARAGQDLDVRIAHWRDALAMRDPGLATELLGMGLGRFPVSHFWRSGEARAASYQVGREGDEDFLRLGTGSPLYVEQFVAARPGQPYRVNVRVRSPGEGGQITASLCEKWLLTSARCVFVGQAVPAGEGWQALSLPLASGAVGAGPWYQARPVKFSLYNSGSRGVVDVAAVGLVGAGGKDLLANGDFAEGMDRWFFSADVDLPWHVWSVPVAALFEMGWLGVVALGWLGGVALVRGGRRAWRGDRAAASVVAVVLGWACLAWVDGVLDSPRMLCLVLFVISLSYGFKPDQGAVAKGAVAG